ncbi:unnamed protein product [Penicillium glandicola]
MPSALSEAKYINFPSLPADAKHPDSSPVLKRHSTLSPEAMISPAHGLCSMPPVSQIKKRWLRAHMLVLPQYGGKETHAACT